jgi:K+-transporting ATPase ATPase A chain
MNLAGWMEISATMALAIALAWPLGAYLQRVWLRQRTWFDPLLGPVEVMFYRVAGVDPTMQQTWRGYFAALLVFNAIGFAFLFCTLILQGFLPLNPQHAVGLSPVVAFNTAISFVTNTGWLPPRAVMVTSELAQLAGMLTQNFLSAGTAMAVAGALTRAFSASRSPVIGNFWSDLVRVTLYFLLPLAILLSLVLAALGLPQTLTTQVDAHTIEGSHQLIIVGPVASQASIAQLGTSGAGIFDPGAAHPFVNPSAISNLLEAATLGLTSFACIFAFGRMLFARAQARILIVAVVLLVTGAASVMYFAEARAPPAVATVRLTANMEGKEVRLGVPASAVFAALSEGSRAGSTNANLESMAPASSGAATFLMQLGGMLPGSAGSGLLSVVMFSLLAVVCGGMLVGRTPEFLGKKIATREIRLVVVSQLVLNASILVLTALAAVTPAALGAVSTRGPHGLMEMAYAYTSAVANTGSAFQGLRADNAYWYLTLGVAMVAGRYGVLAPALAIAGSLAAKPKIRPTDGALPTDGPLFAGLLISVLLILTGLQFLPLMMLGPIVEQVQISSMQRDAVPTGAAVIHKSP